MSRTPPRPTAEYAIGPAHGTYAAARQPSGEPTAGHALRAMTRDSTIHRAPPAASMAYTLRLLHKQNGTNLCPPPSHTCWGAPGTAQDMDYICCDQDEDCALNGNEPGCRLKGLATKAIASLPSDQIPRHIKDTIYGMVHG